MKVTGKHISINAAWTLLFKSFGAISSILVTIMLTRVLPASEMGYFLLAQSYAVFFAMLARLGMKQPVVKLIAESLSKNELKKIRGVIYSAALIIFVWFTIIIAFLWSYCGQWLFETLLSAKKLYESRLEWSLLILIIAYQVPIAESFRGFHNIKLAALFDGPLGNFFLLATLVIIYIRGVNISFEIALLVLFCSFLLSCVFGVIELIKILRKIPGGGGVYPIKDLLKEGIPILIVNITTYITDQSGVWICGAFLPPDKTAILGATLKLVLIISLPLFVLNMVIQPVIVHLHSQGRKRELEKKIRISTTIATIPSLLICIIFVAHSHEILEMGFGVKYIDGSPALIILAVAQLVNVWAGPCINFMLLVGNRLLVTAIILFVSAGSGLWALYLVKEYGINGVALASAVGIITQNILVWLLTIKLTEISTHSYSNPLFLYKLLIAQVRKPQ